MVELEVKIKERSLEIELLNQRLSGEEPMIVDAATFNTNTPYQSEFFRLTILLEEMLQNKKTDHPDVVRVRNELAAVNKLLDEEKETNEATEKREVMSPVFQQIKANLQSAEIELEGMQLQKMEFEKIIVDLEEKVGHIPKSELVLNRLEREAQINRELFNTLKVKSAQARITQEVEIESQEEPVPDSRSSRGSLEALQTESEADHDRRPDRGILSRLLPDLRFRVPRPVDREGRGDQPRLRGPRPGQGPQAVRLR